MAEPASRPSALDEEAPSLDPAAIERAYRRERDRRHLRSLRRDDARSSSARFFVAISALLFITVVIALSTMDEIQHMFGI